MQPPKGHQLIITEDGTPTLLSERFEEACHSTSGAKEETWVHYIKGCHVEEFFEQQDSVHILEVGYGTGLGWQETQKLALNYPSKTLHFYSLELDEELVKWSLPDALKIDESTHILYKHTIGNSNLTVIVGDARIELPYWKSKLPPFEAIYQDAFSPRKNPTLWTVQWFKLLSEVSKSGTYLSTYSSSISIRKALLDAGWGVYPGEAFARKKSSTRAQWGKPPDEALVAELAKHPTEALKDTEVI